MLWTLAGLCLFFGAMAVTAAIGGLLVTLAKNVARLF